MTAETDKSKGGAPSTTTAAASFIETLGRKASIVSPRTDDGKLMAHGGMEPNIHPTAFEKALRSNSIVAGASPFAANSSLWAASSDSLLEGHYPSVSAAESAWETPRRASVSALTSSSNWKCVGSAASMLTDKPASVMSGSVPAPNAVTASSASTAMATTTATAPAVGTRLRAASIVIDRPSFAAVAMRGHGPLDEEPVSFASSSPAMTEQPDLSRPSSVLSNGHFMQLPALLHEEIGIESAREAAEIFKRSSMDSLLDFDPTSLFSLAGSRGTADLSGSTLMSSVPADLRRHSVNWFDGQPHVQSTDGMKMTAVSSLMELPSLANSNGASPAPSSSPMTAPSDTFPEEFIFAPSSVAQFSKKRFARRHSIAADGVSSLEDSFSRTLSFNGAVVSDFSPHLSAMGGAGAGAGAMNDAMNGVISGAPISNGAMAYHHQHQHQHQHHQHQHHHQHQQQQHPHPHQHQHSAYYGAPAATVDYPFNGNIYAAYSGLLQNDVLESEETTLDAPPGGVNFLSAMMKGASAVSSVMHHQPPLSLSPAQAGISPTPLPFPNASFHLSTHRGPLYLIEFKAGRTEIFFVVDMDTTLTVTVGDLVIVEADRGEDLGRITGELPSGKIRQLIAQLPVEGSHNGHHGHGHGYGHSHSHGHNNNHHDSNDDSYGPNGANVNHNLAGLKDFEIAALIASKEIVPKRVHRHATPLDVKFLQAKAQEEALAMVRCQARIRQKKLPMDVVDAEYQWDRNKLTFYFAADRRIDFRELVRDLFRIYKTRIWMCAVDKNRATLLNSLAAMHSSPSHALS